MLFFLFFYWSWRTIFLLCLLKSATSKLLKWLCSALLHFPWHVFTHYCVLMWWVVWQVCVVAAAVTSGKMQRTSISISQIHFQLFDCFFFVFVWLRNSRSSQCFAPSDCQLISKGVYANKDPLKKQKKNKLRCLLQRRWMAGCHGDCRYRWPELRTQQWDCVSMTSHQILIKKRQERKREGYYVGLFSETLIVNSTALLCCQPWEGQGQFSTQLWKVAALFMHLISSRFQRERLAPCFSATHWFLSASYCAGH